MTGAPEKSGRSTVYLVDGTYTVFRSFFAIGRLTAPDGTPTSGVLGLVNTVRKIVRERRPEHLGVAFDVEGPTHRDELFEAYKANRPEPPAELVQQFPLAREACRALGWPELTAEGYEADDVIATLAREAAERGLDVVIVTSDKDLYQLVGGPIRVLNPAKDDRMLDPDGVEELFGVRPEQVVDVLALMGDKTDNVPGVPGIGEKTAKAMIRRYGSLDAVRERARLFHELWEAREAIAARLKAKEEIPPELIGRLAAPAEKLAGLERKAGGPEADDLVARFAAAAALASKKGVTPREIKKVVTELGKKTQPKAWLAIATHEPELDLSRRLVTVRTDAPVRLDLEAMRPGQPDLPAAQALFRRLGFRRLTEELAQQPGAEPPPDEREVAVRILAGDRPALGRLARAERLGIAVPPPVGEAEAPAGVGLAAGEEKAAFLPLAGKPGKEVRALLGPDGPPKTGHDLKAACHRLAGAGLELAPLAFDTMLAGLLIDPAGRERSAAELAARLLGEAAPPAPAPPPRGRQATLPEFRGEVPAADAVREAAEPAGREAALVLKLEKELTKRLEEHGLRDLFREIEMPLVPVLFQMERAGIGLDRERLAELSERLGKEIERLEREIHALAGHEFNVNSPAQLRKVLFEELKLAPTGRRTQKTRAHSTGQEALEALALEHELPAKVLEYRELAKLKSTYVDALPQFVSERTGRLHTRFHQLGAATGRLSSSDPNLQNIPVRTELGRTIRAAFVPEPGWRFMSADYSQMELRVLAHLSGDETLVEAFRRDLDIHRYTASLVAGVPLEEVTPEMRSRAKAVNFGIIYGMSEFRLAREQKMSRDEARAFIAAYFERYPAVKRYIDGVIAEVRQTGEVRTLFGRVRFFPELTGEAGGPRLNHAVREQLLRQAVNTTVQGSAADIVKIAMVRAARRLASEGFRARLLLQVHDELLIEVPSGEVAPVARLVREIMESVARLEVPLKVDIGVADNWAETH